MFHEHQKGAPSPVQDRKSTRLNSSHVEISYAVFCLKKKNILSRTPPSFFKYVRENMIRHEITSAAFFFALYASCLVSKSEDPCCISRRIFFFNDTATTEIYTLSLHDALPI